VEFLTDPEVRMPLPSDCGFSQTQDLVVEISSCTFAYFIHFNLLSDKLAIESQSKCMQVIQVLEIVKDW
jgi:hypothetical protein